MGKNQYETNLHFVITSFQQMCATITGTNLRDLCSFYLGIFSNINNSLFCEKHMSFIRNFRTGIPSSNLLTIWERGAELKQHHLKNYLWLNLQKIPQTKPLNIMTSIHRITQLFSILHLLLGN